MNLITNFQSDNRLKVILYIVAQGFGNIHIYV